jgi:hypothetical protein
VCRTKPAPQLSCFPSFPLGIFAFPNLLSNTFDFSLIFAVRWLQLVKFYASDHRRLAQRMAEATVFRYEWSVAASKPTVSSPRAETAAVLIPLFRVWKVSFFDFDRKPPMPSTLLIQLFIKMTVTLKVLFAQPGRLCCTTQFSQIG